MPETAWFRSLYWRFAIGFVALLATLLVVQGSVFLWMTGQMPDLFPSRSPAQFAAAIATGLSETLAVTPDIDIDEYVNTNHSSRYRSFAVVMTDGRQAISRRVPPPAMLSRAARGRLFGDMFSDRGGPDRGPGRPGPDRFGPGDGRPAGDGRLPGEARPPGEVRPPADARPPGDVRIFGDGRGDPRGPGQGFGRGGGRGGGRGDGRGPGPGGPGTEYAPVVVNGSTVGMVAVPIGSPPLSITLRALGPILSVVALALLVVGTAIAALLVFRPTHRRLSALQDAARRLGAGESGVRAPVSGRDEVASLAVAFNDMAGELEERARALDGADRTRRQLLADVSHELTTPLAAIRGYVETLGMPDMPLDEKTRSRYLGIVTEETERLEHIVGDLLELARLEGGGGSLRMEQVAVSQLLERVRHRHGPVVRDRGITLDTIQEPDVSLVFGDANRLEQAVQNLVANAVRHTPDGGHVTVRARAVTGGVMLTVEDSGPGIPAEHLPRVFDRFYKVDASRTGTTMPSGSGLGLSIVQTIVARHGGTVAASNVPNGGACFEIFLPTGAPPATDLSVN
jgi:signal transduction histidine kinase